MKMQQPLPFGLFLGCTHRVGSQDMPGHGTVRHREANVDDFKHGLESNMKKARSLIRGVIAMDDPAQLTTSSGCGREKIDSMPPAVSWLRAPSATPSWLISRVRSWKQRQRLRLKIRAFARKDRKLPTVVAKVLMPISYYVRVRLAPAVNFIGKARYFVGRELATIDC